MLLSCARMPDPQPSWTFSPGGIGIQYRADAMLNAFNGEAHTIVLVIYQLTSLDAFDSLTKSEEGLRTLLEARRFDPGVVGTDKLVIQPGDKNRLRLDRAEQARWVGIVAGYYDLVPGQVDHAVQISFNIEETGTIRKKKTARVNPLLIDLTLGSRAIYKVGTL
jgi:type VI secretion system VasD/TssJ family lipoprotein